MLKRVILTLFFTGMLLSLVVRNTGRTTESVKANQSLKSGSSLLMYENVTTHDGDLIINGTQNFVIENCTYIQTGNILVKDNASLFIRNATLQLNQTYVAQFRTTIDGYSDLEILDAEITSQHENWMAIYGYSRLFFNSSTLRITFVNLAGHATGVVAYSYVLEVTTGQNARTTMLESNSQGVSLSFERYSSASISGLRPGYMNFWDLNINGTVPQQGFDIILNHTQVDNWKISLHFECNLTLSDSSLGEIILLFPASTGIVEGLKPGFLASWSLKSIRLIDTDVGGWFVSISDSYVNILDSNCGILIYGTSDVSVTDSSIIFCDIAWSKAHIQLNQTTWTGTVTFIESNFYLYGNNSYHDITTRSWALTNATRNYNIIVTDMNGSRLDHVGLTLFDKYNVNIWNGTTDSSGTANFNLTFTDSNYTDTLRLQASKGELFAAKDIEFLSDTPVTLVMMTTATADINNDGSVDIYDAILLANSYNSIPTSPNWNSKADLNSDNIVDIYDAILLAKNYGKST